MEANELRRLATEEAGRWWIRMQPQSPAGMTSEELRQFTQWLRESPQHVAAMLHVAHVHDALERFKRWDEIATEGTDESDKVIALREPVPRDAPARPRRARAAWMTAALAAGLCALAVGTAWLRFGRGEVIVTDRAERREVMLSDGSVVRLEPESMVRASMREQERSITLVRGRALFNVSKDPERPFVVEANHTVVRAIGTAFGVEHTKEEVIVTVAEGQVAVRPATPSALPAAAEQRDTPELSPTQGQRGSVKAGEVLLTAGKQVVVQPSGSAEPVREVDTERALAWSEGRLVFDGVPLRKVAEEFNRYNHVQLRIEGDDLAQRSVRGVFQASDAETLIAFIRTGARVSVTYPDRQQIVIAPLP
jgi:transmembrane sensor